MGRLQEGGDVIHSVMSSVHHFLECRSWEHGCVLQAVQNERVVFPPLPLDLCLALVRRQVLRHIDMSSSNGYSERSSSLVVRLFHTRPVQDQVSNYRYMAVITRYPEWCRAFITSLIGQCSGIDQQTNNNDLTFVTRYQEWCRALFISLIDLNL